MNRSGLTFTLLLACTALAAHAAPLRIHEVMVGRWAVATLRVKDGRRITAEGEFNVTRTAESADVLAMSYHERDTVSGDLQWRQDMRIELAPKIDGKADLVLLLRDGTDLRLPLDFSAWASDNATDIAASHSVVMTHAADKDEMLIVDFVMPSRTSFVLTQTSGQGRRVNMYIANKESHPLAKKSWLNTILIVALVVFVLWSKGYVAKQKYAKQAKRAKAAATDGSAAATAAGAATATATAAAPASSNDQHLD